MKVYMRRAFLQMLLTLAMSLFVDIDRLQNQSRLDSTYIQWKLRQLRIDILQQNLACLLVPNSMCMNSADKKTSFDSVLVLLSQEHARVVVSTDQEEGRDRMTPDHRVRGVRGVRGSYL